MEDRLESLEREVRRLRRTVTICATLLAIGGAMLLFPAASRAIMLALIAGAAVLVMLLLISAFMGVLEWLSPSGRLEERAGDTKSVTTSD